MTKIKVVGTNVPNSNVSILSNSEFANVNTIFNIGDFNITTNLNKRKINDYTTTLTSFSKPITLDTLGVDFNNIDKHLNTNNNLNINFDKKNLYNYAYYGSLYDRIRTSVDNIILNWCGSLFVNKYNSGNNYNTIINYNYNHYDDISSFNIPLFLVENKFLLDLTNNIISDTTSDDIKLLSQQYLKYNVLNLDTAIEYPVLSFTGLTNSNQTTLYFTVKGNPFPTASGGTLSTSYHIKPNETEYAYFYNKLDDFEKYLINTDSTPKFTISVKVPIINEDDDILIYNDKNYTWTTNDGYNIDIDTSSFKTYLNDLISLSTIYDEFKTDIIYRMLIPSSVTNTDTTVYNKSKQISRILGREVDEIKKFIDGIAFVNTISYDKVENTPDLFIKNLAQTLGWKTFNTLETDDLFNSIFSKDIQGVNNSLSANELDIEFWRRILLNTNYLFKSKGTRKAIEAIFALIGLPDCFIEVNEYVYTVEGKINPNDTSLPDLIYPLNEELTTLPYDSEGYPIASNEISDYYFQISGDTDFGQSYLDVYRKLGFKIHKTIDNRKSWVFSTGKTTHYDDFTNTETNYSIDSSKLIINTKEIGIFVDPIKAIECDVYDYNFNYNYPVSSTGRTTPPYPDRLSNIFNVSGLTFNEYIFDIYSKFINVQNRKVVEASNGINYPSLYKLYEDYLLRTYSENGTLSKQYDIKRIFNYIKKFQNQYQNFMFQLIPATTIIAEDGMKVRNTIFTEQKFTYKHGIDDSSEFSSNQPISTETSLNNIKQIGITFNEPIVNKTYIFKSLGVANFTGTNDNTTNTSNLLIKVSQTIKPKDRWTTSLFSFDVPSFTMSGTTKIGSLPLNNSVYYIDTTTTGKTLSFIFTGNTTSLTGNTEYGIFNYKLFNYNNSTTEFNTTSVYDKTVPHSYFSGGTNLYTDIINNTSLTGDTEYLIKSYYTYNKNTTTGETIDFYTNNEPYNVFTLVDYPQNQDKYEFYYDYSKYKNYTGTTYSTESDYSALSFPYKTYDSSEDWYFVVVKSPEKPSLLNLTPNSTTSVLGTYITETFSPDINGNVILSYIPNGDITLTLNGITLVKNVEYSGVTNVIAPLTDRLFYIAIPTITTDTVTVSYVINSLASEMISESEVVNYVIPSGTTQTAGKKILYDTSINKYVFFSDNTNIGDTNRVQISLNGLIQVPTTDYSLSTLVSNKIIINTNLETNDIVTAYYVDNSTTTIYTITTNPFTFEWSIGKQIPIENGIFTLKFADLIDTTFTNVLATGTTPFISGENIFDLTVDFSTPQYSGLTLGNVYNIMVDSTRYFTGITGTIVPVTTSSDYTMVKIPI
jgi:hypothetical protein